MNLVEVGFNLKDDVEINILSHFFPYTILL
jgi:hypothetical protein